MKRLKKTGSGKYKSLKREKAKTAILPKFKRPRGRPPKNTMWDSSSGQYVSFFNFPKDIVKAANERLRKLEKVHGLSESSEIYQLMEKYKTSYPNTKGKIYRTNEKGYGVRFIGKKEFDKLSNDEKEYYIERLIRFMESASSTKTGIKTAHETSYKTFMQNYGDKYPGLTFDQYSEFWKTFNQKVTKDKNDHYGYTDITQALNNVRIDQAIRAGQMNQIMEYIRSGKQSDWNELRKNYKQYMLNI